MSFPGKTPVIPRRASAGINRFCLILLILGVAFKFWLIATTDISDATNDPHEYVTQVLHPLDGGIAYGPGTGLFGRLFYELRIPFRIGIEITFMVAVALVLRALIDWPFRNYAACGLFLFAIFNPAPAELFSHFYSDQIWMVETMLGLACLILALQDPVRPRGILLAFSAGFLGISTITRSVFTVLAVALVLFTLISSILILRRGGWSRFRTMLFIFLISMYAVVMGTTAIYYTTCSYEFYRHHYFGISAIDCSEYRNFYLCLQSVGDPTGVNYFPIDEDRRKLIAQAGPHARTLMDQMDQFTLFKDVSFDAYGKHDFAFGWFHFAVLAANGADTDKNYAEFKDIENEIRDSAQRGQLKVRSILPLPDSRINLVFPILPASLLSTIRASVHEPVPNACGWSTQKLGYDNPEFSQALTRHAVRDSPARYHLWWFFYSVYSHLYTTAAVILLLILIFGFWIFLAIAWQPAMENSLSLLAGQVFALLYIALIFWYALFDASGMPMMTRYMIFQNVMLPILIVYYPRAFWNLGRGYFRRQNVGAMA